MKMLMKPAAVIFLFLLVVVVVSHARALTLDVSPSDSDVTRAAQFAVDEQNERQGTDLRFARVDRVTVEVLQDGKLYNIWLDAQDGDSGYDLFHAVVWSQGSNGGSLILQSFTEVA